MNVNTLLRNSDASSKYGAPMGRTNHCDNPEAIVVLQPVAMVDGDYDAGGAYWGGSWPPLWCAADEDGQVLWFGRADRYETAVKALLEWEPGLHVTPGTTIDLDLFVEHYIEAMLWTEEENLREEWPDGDVELSGSLRADIITECRTFIEANVHHLLTFDGPRSTEEQGGHDFWLTRNGHGAGFWDGDWSDEAGEALSDAARKFGSVDVYVVDGILYS